MTRQLGLAMQSVYGNLPKPTNTDVLVLAIVKGAERYVFLYDEATKADVLRVIGRFACNPELSFSWYDAAVLSQKVRAEDGCNGK